MRLIFCVALAVLLGNFVPTTLARKSDEFDEDDQTKITDLTLNCVYVILEHLDYRSFDDLLSVAQISDRFSKVAADLVRRKHSKSTFIIWYDFLLPHNPDKLLDIAGMEIDADTIERENRNISLDYHNRFQMYERIEINLNTSDLILDTFKHFGHVIKHLELNSNSKNRHLQAELIGKLIDKYSSESSIVFDIGNKAEIVLLYIKKPLINVFNVTLATCDMEYVCEQGIRVNDVFPAVRYLDVQYVYFLKCFDHNIPHLEHISVLMSGLDYPWSEFPGVFEKNPQIQSVTLIRVQPKHLQMVNTFLPQLKNLTLHEYFSFNQSIQFENVTRLDASYFQYRTFVANLHFPRLQTLIIFCEDPLFAGQITFLNEHKHLKHLHLRYPTNSTEFQQYTTDLTELVELTVEQRFEFRQRQEPLRCAVIMEFLSSHDKLQRFNINTLPEDCKKQLKNEWTMRHNGKFLTFRRKKNH